MEAPPEGRSGCTVVPNLVRGISRKKPQLGAVRVDGDLEVLLVVGRVHRWKILSVWCKCDCTNHCKTDVTKSCRALLHQLDHGGWFMIQHATKSGLSEYIIVIVLQSSIYKRNNPKITCSKHLCAKLHQVSLLRSTSRLLVGRLFLSPQFKLLCLCFRDTFCSLFNSIFKIFACDRSNVFFICSFDGSKTAQ